MVDRRGCSPRRNVSLHQRRPGLCSLPTLYALSGVIAGIVAWRVSASKDSGGAASSGGLQYIEGTAKVVKSDPSDPSQFEKDPALKKSFWGMTYTPFLAQEPWCGVTLANVTEDIQWLSQTTCESLAPCL